jgi:hypothetical protein
MKTAKTAREWFETFPEPYRSQAIANCLYPNDRYRCASDALGNDFNWDTTDEGYRYWDMFYKRLVKES